MTDAECEAQIRQWNADHPVFDRTELIRLLDEARDAYLQAAETAHKASSEIARLSAPGASAMERAMQALPDMLRVSGGYSEIVKRVAITIEQAVREGCAAALDEAAQRLEKRAAHFPVDTIFNGKIMREELQSCASAIRSLTRYVDSKNPAEAIRTLAHKE